MSSSATPATKIASEVAVFFQEPYFYYLSGHDEPGAALVLIPAPPSGKTFDGPREILYLPPRDPSQEKWEGPKLGPDDPGIAEKTGFRAVEPFAKLHERSRKPCENLSALLYAASAEAGGWLSAPHEIVCADPRRLCLRPISRTSPRCSTPCDR